MQMEDKAQPVIHTIKDPPPSESPPSLEKHITPHVETIQWIDDVKTTANISLLKRDTRHAALLSGETYSPKINKLSTNIAINKYNLEMQQDKQFQPIRNTRTMHKLNIPTPKSSINNAYEHSNTLHYTTWKDDTTHMWTRVPNGKWEIPPEASYKDTPPHTTPHIPTLNGAKVSIDTIKAATHQPDSTTVRIIPIQDDIGANQNVTHIRSIIHGYVDIEPYPIGGVKVDDIAIVCTGKGYLPWLSKEGVCTMVPILFSKEVDGTIVSPTTIVLHYKEKYTGFVIETNTDDGTGVLRLVHRDGVHHLTFPMTMYNSLWFHEYKPPHLHSTTPPHAATVNRMNDACLSNLWHGRLAHAGEDVADEIHKHVIGINKPL